MSTKDKIKGLEIAPFYFDKKCSECCHWAEQPISNDLQRSGVCRLTPPSPVAIPAQQSISVQFLYPMLGAENGACAGFDDLLVQE